MRQATPDDAKIISDILTEAALWQKERGYPAWQLDTLTEEKITPQIDQFFLMEMGDEAAGTLKFQTEDKLFWPDQSEDEATYVQKVAVRRKFAGGAISHAMLMWAVERTRTHHRKYLRLDCNAASPGLRSIYEKFGFVYHSDKSMGAFVVARYQYKI